jgi:hypothetical protein
MRLAARDQYGFACRFEPKIARQSERLQGSTETSAHTQIHKQASARNGELALSIAADHSIAIAVARWDAE